MEAKAIIKELRSKAKVYAPYILLRSLEVWKAQTQISIPSQIRQLLELTYNDRDEAVPLADEPVSWKELSCEWFGSDSAKKMTASRNCNLWQVALEDEEGVQTRLNEITTVSVVLCWSINKHEAVFVDDTSEKLGRDTFRLSTAQAIHKNLVKVPEYCFDRIKLCSAFTGYLYGRQCAGIVLESGEVEVNGLNSGTRLVYSDKLGLVIEKTDTKEEI